MSIRIAYSSISITNDYDKALDFYTNKLGFVKKTDMPLGPDARWLTVVSPEDPNGTELLLEPNADYPAMKALKADLVRDGIPFTAFQVKDIHAEYERMKALGVEFVMEPTDNGHFIQAVLDDTCGNLIQIFQLKG
jgi:catechol 2,3-dioxygenase-like lactoylglutathione lyase family enzyme